MSDNATLTKILTELHEIRQMQTDIAKRQDEIIEAQEAANSERRRIFRSIFEASPQAPNRHRNTIGAIADLRARYGRLSA